ncbi:MAG TPA: hypothetical protein VNO31_49725 [Umezawaea sp.]|nr:hypothetical protein [Umezawaea sp.]
MVATTARPCSAASANSRSLRVELKVAEDSRTRSGYAGGTAPRRAARSTWAVRRCGRAAGCRVVGAPLGPPATAPGGGSSRRTAPAGCVRPWRWIARQRWVECGGGVAIDAVAVVPGHRADQAVVVGFSRRRREGQFR